MRYLDPKADLTFKKIFGEHKDLLMSLLNALLPLEKDRQVESLEYLPAELVPDLPFGKNLKSATLLKSQSVAAQTAKNAIFLVWTDFLPCVG